MIEGGERGTNERSPGIQSVGRAIAALEIIAQEGGHARLQDIAERAGLKKSTTHNILATLASLGYVRRRDSDARYYLGERILNLARVIGDDDSLRGRLRPVLEAIRMRANETVFLAVPSGDHIYFIDGIDADDPEGKCSRIGAHRPLEGSSIGLVFLSFIPELRRRVLSTRPDVFGPEFDSEIETVKRRGFALGEQNASNDHCCVAVPVFEGGKVCAAFGVRGPSDRLTREVLNEVAWMMIEQVGRIRPRNENEPWWFLPATA